MRHNSAGRRLGRTTSHRIAMFRNMVTSFLQHEKITTTDAKAKELRSIAEKMITLGKRGDLHATRQAAAYIRDKKVVTKLFTEIAPRYTERPGGYTRIIKLGIRPGDNAPVSVLELVEAEMKSKKAAAKAAKAPKAAKAAPVAAAPAEEAPVAEAPAAEETTEA
ncbi:ribosomal protein L17 [Citrifermentans bemidjiense Bem]|uniref:Large ribosomal subunit protein bL17 n=1 Tax=Citrifermentans bemidjiense (strain ATCC BAA-1014 / DSM 16622 / JCM 12645 / Bem) TaxID=404380 RepID=B5EFS8_CITBB|nr:50S ribosomal protein L17 [Citrifermentans bemidjiense]ACH37982.2 ribosomal protein L17 [Citrifermentans bemidjiense Bem]